MKENKYDDPLFFEQYSKMNRSLRGLQGAGEWHTLKSMLPDLQNKDILDLGCGFGWHCRYAIENGARSVTGVDISKKMLAKAAEINQLEGITYINKALEDLKLDAAQFDVVFSSLAFHYLQSFDIICKNINKWLKPGGSFVFSVEHPVFTASGSQDWVYGPDNKKLHWPVDRYFEEDKRETVFLGEQVIKYHRTLTTYLNTIIQAGFIITGVQEPLPEKDLMKIFPEMAEELRRPMMLLVSAVK